MGDSRIMFLFFGNKTYSKDDLDRPFYKLTFPSPMPEGNKPLDDYHTNLLRKIVGIKDPSEVKQDEELLTIQLAEFYFGK
jgi:hypothetical protein